MAVARPELACAISWAGPTDLIALNSPQVPVYYSVRALATTIGNNLAAWSPARLARQIRARVLLLYAIDDPLVPVSQGHKMKAALPRAQLILLRSGRAEFVHSRVDRGELARAITVEDRLLASVARNGR
jgi:pimeloyl-ACP methyl ester carboxylesterase